MAASSDVPEPNSADEQLLPPVPPDTAEQIVHDMQAVNQQLLLAGLREQTLAEQLRRQLAFTTAITTSLGEGVFVLDTTGQCTFVNPAAEQMLGWTSEELRGQNINLIFPSQTEQGTTTSMASAPLLDVLRFGTVHRDEDALFVHRNGSMFPTAYTAAPITTDGQIDGAVVTFRDMTEVRRLQRTREDYLALISHDLRSPLTAILGRAQILLRRLTQQGFTREAESARIVVESSLRMNTMIEDLLERNRTDAHIHVRQRSIIDLVAVVQRMLEQTVTPEDSQRVRLEAILSLPVVVDVVQIERVIVNLLTNALKFSSPDAPVVIRVYQHATDAIVAVTDQGIGIMPEDQRHLFQKHYRAHGVEQIAGNGLGLYSSRLIVEAHGGQLWAESTLGEGSTFTLALPLPG